jgi:enoyl-CoA hydratase
MYEPGVDAAQEMVLTGKNISAAEAERMGLVSRVVPVDKTLATAIEVAQTIAGTLRVACRVSRVACCLNGGVG